VKLWRPSAYGHRSPQPLGHHSDYVKCLSSPGLDFNFVASGGLDKRICLWDLTGAGDVLKINMADDEGPPSVKGSVYALATTANLVAAGGPESVVRVWDARTGKRVTKFVGHTDIVRAVLVAEDGETVLSASSDQTVKVWSLREGRCMYTLTMHNDSVWNLYSDDPRLGVFWSADRSGLVAKTDVRGKASFDDGLCVAVCQEDGGIHSLIQAGGFIWTSTSSSSINRWNDVRTEDADILLPEPYTMQQHRGSISTLTKPRFHSGSISMQRNPSGDSSRYMNSSPARKNSSAFAINHIPFRSLLKLSNTAAFPVLRKQDVETSTLHSTTSRKKPSDAGDYEETGLLVPMRASPDHTIEGQHGLIKHVLLNDRRQVLTLDTAGEVMLWDLLKVRQTMHENGVF
jgi:WD repeat-containing protein 48